MSTDIMGSRSFLQRLDFNLISVILVLNVIGLINLYSATHNVADVTKEGLFYQQVVWLIGGWGVFLATTLIDYHFFQRMAWLIYIVNFLALLATDLKGKTVLGAQRWLDLGFFRYQPSETMKIAVVLVLASYLAKIKIQDGLSLRQLVVPGLVLLFPFLVTLDQPDLGTAMLIAGVGVAMLMFVRVRKWILASALVMIVAAVPIMWKVGLKEYQRNRIVTFLSPGHDPRGVGYNSIQSRIAVGSGGFFGKGFRKGTQSQLEFIPERHSDFIYSVLSEEHGFVGSVATLGLFVVLFLTGLRISSQGRDRFGALITVGVMAILFMHVFINIGMVIGLLPIVGIPLPLLSYGGSSMLTTMLGLGLVSSVAWRRYLF